MNPTSSGGKNYAHHKNATYCKPCIAPSPEALSILTESPKLAASMLRQGLIRYPGNRLPETVIPFAK